MPKIYILTGLPASGKSTWRENFFKKNDPKDWVVISSDDLIEQLGAQVGLKYAEAWPKFNGQAAGMVKTMFKQAINNNTNIIVDMTNMSAKIRRKWLKPALDNCYEAYSVNFIVNDVELKRRLKERGEKTGKWIPDFVINNMAGIYDRPSKDEGFTILEEVKF